MFTPLSFFVRWIISLFIVFATYNPSEYSYYHWLLTDPSQQGGSLKLFFGLVLLTVYGIYFISIWRSMGPLGISMTIAVFTTFIWTLVDFNLVNIDGLVDIVLLSLIATVLTFGVSWSHIRTRLSGQVDSKDVNTY